MTVRCRWLVSKLLLNKRPSKEWRSSAPKSWTFSTSSSISNLQICWEPSINTISRMIRTSSNSEPQTCRPKMKLRSSLPAKQEVQSRHKAIFYRSKTTWRSSWQFKSSVSLSWKPKLFHSRWREESCWEKTRNQSTKSASCSSRRSRRLPSQEWQRQLLSATRSQCLSSKHQPNTTCQTQTLPRK